MSLLNADIYSNGEYSEIVFYESDSPWHIASYRLRNNFSMYIKRIENLKMTDFTRWILKNEFRYKTHKIKDDSFYCDEKIVLDKEFRTIRFSSLGKALKASVKLRSSINNIKI